MNSPKLSPLRRWNHPGVVIVAAVIATTLVSTAAVALSNQRVTATGSVAAARLEVTHSDLPRTVFLRDSYTTTDPVTVTNATTTTSPKNASVVTTFSMDSGDASLAASTVVSIWPTANASRCTNTGKPGKGLVTGSWANPITMASTSLAPGASRIYCLRTTLTSNPSENANTQSLVTKVQSTMEVYEFTTDNETTGSLTVRAPYPEEYPPPGWYRLRPVGTTHCMAVASVPGTGSGAPLVEEDCQGQDAETSSHYQWFTFPFYTQWLFDFAMIQPRAPEGFGVGATDSLVELQRLDIGNFRQWWTMHRVADDTYQFVTRSSELCLTAEGAEAATLSKCNDLDTQHFELEKIATDYPLPYAQTAQRTPRELPQSGQQPPLVSPSAEPKPTPSPTVEENEPPETPQSSDPDPTHTSQPAESELPVPSVSPSPPPL